MGSHYALVFHLPNGLRLRRLSGVPYVYALLTGTVVEGHGLVWGWQSFHRTTQAAEKAARRVQALGPRPPQTSIVRVLPMPLATTAGDKA